MSAKKVTSVPGTVAAVYVGRARRLLRGWLGMALLVVLAAAGLGGGAYALWRHVSPHVLAGSEYQLDPHNIDLTPPPAWITSDIRASAIQAADLRGKVSILDSSLQERVARAFAVQPWVAKVHQVTKEYPARLRVVVSYRQPVAMVEVAGGLLPVDIEGILLPSGDFSPAAAQRYPRIAEIASKPMGLAGTRWGDLHVVGGAQIAAALGANWQRLGLARIVPPTRAAGKPNADDVTYELFTAHSTRIIWGRAPAAMSTGETPAAEKVARLLRYASERGSLDDPKAGQTIDVRGERELMVLPRGEVQPPPEEKAAREPTPRG